MALSDFWHKAGRPAKIGAVCQADGAGGGEDPTAAKFSNCPGQPEGAVGKAGPGGGGKRHSREKEKLAETGGKMDEHAEGG